MSDGGDCRTAPATPGLLKIQKILKNTKKSKVVKKCKLLLKSDFFLYPKKQRLTKKIQKIFHKIESLKNTKHKKINIYIYI